MNIIDLITTKENTNFIDKIINTHKVNNFEGILLNGNLGSGKTFFTKNLLKKLGLSEQEITSPTFGLMNEYNSQIGKILHFDLYRVNNPSELENIGFEELINDSFFIIEWPEIGLKFLDGFKILNVNFEFIEGQPDKRRIFASIENR